MIELRNRESLIVLYFLGIKIKPENPAVSQHPPPPA